MFEAVVLSTCSRQYTGMLMTRILIRVYDKTFTSHTYIKPKRNCASTFLAALRKKNLKEKDCVTSAKKINNNNNTRYSLLLRREQ